MYDWKRREDTKNLLRQDYVGNEKINDFSVNSKSNLNSNSQTPSKQRQQYPYHHLNISQNIYNGEANQKQFNLSTEKKIRTRSNRTYDHSPIFGYDRLNTEMKDESAQKSQKQLNVRNTNTFSSTVFKQSVEEIPNMINYDRKNNLINDENKNIGDKSRNTSNSNKFTLSYKENNDLQTEKIFKNKKHIDSKDNNIFKPLTPRSARENQYKIRDHTTEELFGDEPQMRIKKPHPQPYEPIYSHRQQSPAYRKQMQFYSSRNSNGDIIPLTNRLERCQTTYENKNQEQQNGVSKAEMNGSTSEQQIRNLTPQLKKQMHILGSFSEHKQSYLTNKNNQQIDNYKDEIRSYNDKWWNKIEKQKNNNAECFLSNKDIAEQQKYKQLKSDFFEEINNQIFGAQSKDINDLHSITAQEIGIRPSIQQQQKLKNSLQQEQQQQKQRSILIPEQQTKQRKWQFDSINEDKRRKDQNYSDLFGYGEVKAPQKSFKDDLLFPANFQGNKYDSVKFQTDYPSANIQYGNENQYEQQEKTNRQENNTKYKLEEQKYGLKQIMNHTTSEQKHYANLSSCLDQNGYNNHYSKDNSWKENKNLKFDKFNVVEKSFDDNQSVSKNFGCPKNDEGHNQRIIEIDFKDFSDKFDQNEFQKYCSRKGIHLVDFQYDFNKLNNKIAGTGQLKIRDIHQDTNRVENVKDHLRQQGLVIKSSRITLTTLSGCYQNARHFPHENSNSQQIQSPSSNFNPNISQQASQQIKVRTNKKNIESKGFKLLVAAKKRVNKENVQVNNTQSLNQKQQYETPRSEIDTAKKVVENHNWKKAIDGVQKENKKNQEIRAKSALINSKYSNPVV